MMTTLAGYFDTLTRRRLDAAPGFWNRALAPRHQRVALLVLDLVGLTLAGLLASLGRETIPGLTDGWDRELFFAVGSVLIVWFIALAATGSYSLRHLRAGATEYRSVITATFYAAGFSGIAFYLLHYEYPRGMYALWFGIGLVSLLTSRLLRRRLMQRLHTMGLMQTPVVVAGADHHVDSIAAVLARETWLGYRVVGAVTREPLLETSTGLPVLGTTAETLEVIEANNVGCVIFAEGSFASTDEFRRMAWKLERHDISMIVVPALSDISSQRVDVRPVAGLPLVDVAPPQAANALRWAKRTTDIVGSLIVLLCVSPIMLGTALAIKLQDRGPVLFRQRRVGRKGAEFDMYKFRSMCVDAEAKLAALEASNEGAGVLFKMADDPRVTKVGKFIRRYSIDELPQLINVLRGDMSLVGPRPALPREVAQYDTDAMRRLDVRPGLTGLWQVSGRSNLSWADTVRLDLYYVDNWSMTQDLLILTKTAKAVIGRDGAY